MPQYLISVHHGPGDDEAMAAMATEEMQRLFEAVGAFNTELQEEGAWVFAGGLQPIGASTCVDATGDAPIITDGPFAESEEHLGGFCIISAADLDEALDWATKASAACQGKVEVRPLQDGWATHGRTPRPTGRSSGSSARSTVVASPVRRLGDVDRAEEAAGEALVAALET